MLRTEIHGHNDDCLLYLSATHPGIQDALRLAFDARGSLPARQTSRTRKTDQSAPMGQSIEVILGIQELQLAIRSSINMVANSIPFSLHRIAQL